MADKFRNSRVGGGLSFFFLVLTVGLILAAFGIGVGVGASIRIPFTTTNLSLGGSLGKKEVVQDTLPLYLRNRVADNKNFFNHTSTMTIWLAEGMGMIVLGNQPEAPVADLNINYLRPPF